MYPSNASDDNLIDRYIDPDVYEHSQESAALPSLQPDPVGPLSAASPHHSPLVPYTTTHHATPTYPAVLDKFGNETGTLSLVDQEAYDIELQTTFGSSHGEHSVDVAALEPFRAFAEENVDQDMDQYMHPFSSAEFSGETWFDRAINASAARNPHQDSATYYTSPLTISISEFDTLYSEKTSVVRNHLPEAKPGPDQLGHADTSSPSFGKSARPKLSAPSATSEHNYGSPLHCHACNRTFTLPKDLKRHMKSIHDQEKCPCPAPGCGLEFARKDKLLQHSRTHSHVHGSVHEDNVSSPPSSVFGGSFLGSDIGSTPVPSEYSDSMPNWDLPDEEFPPVASGHLGPNNEDKNKRFECPHCKLGFNLQHDCLRHIRTIHSREVNGPMYRCAAPRCAKLDKIWTRLDNFKIHLANKHRDQSIPELVQKSKILGSSGNFTVTTPAMFSR